MEEESQEDDCCNTLILNFIKAYGYDEEEEEDSMDGRKIKGALDKYVVKIPRQMINYEDEQEEKQKKN